MSSNFLLLKVAHVIICSTVGRGKSFEESEEKNKEQGK